MMADRRGRPADAAARRRQTTAAGRKGETELDVGTPEIIAKRARITPLGSTGFEFPLDVIEAHGLITRDQYIAGSRYAQLAWKIFGFPGASCAAVYERMVSPAGDEDFTPRATAMETDAETEERHIAERQELREMTAQLVREYPGVLEAVRSVAQYMQMPRYMGKYLFGDNATPLDKIRFDDFIRGLTVLAKHRRNRLSVVT